ncbi:FKBP-type peptidyl-prolyl cis-trans isomerase [Crocinitomicaceae bacterium]|nr:FKBP-type peptidyl-prolyl cis-trans isomerase [Crocinitomicaceae bacterium]
MTKTNMKSTLAICALALGLLACDKKSAEEQATEDNTIILNYISEQNLVAEATGSGLYVVIENEGNGTSCNSTSTVRVAYTGYFTHGTQFDSSPAGGIEFPLQNVITGWTEGIPYFKEGGTGKLLVPSALAYGTSGTTGIPPNTVLIFDIELIEVIE